MFKVEAIIHKVMSMRTQNSQHRDIAKHTFCNQGEGGFPSTQRYYRRFLDGNHPPPTLIPLSPCVSSVLVRIINNLFLNSLLAIRIALGSIS
jgi:hypothetical protein